MDASDLENIPEGTGENWNHNNDDPEDVFVGGDRDALIKGGIKAESISTTKEHSEGGADKGDLAKEKRAYEELRRKTEGGETLQ